jgi:hypothetical protein
MDRRAGPAAFVQRLYDLGCKPGTCYDGLSVHISLHYPIPPPSTPCYPAAGGAYSVRCVEDVRNAAHAPIRIIVGETGYYVPGNVPDEATKASALVAEMETFAAIPYIDGVSYANIDECDLYRSGYFAGGCLIAGNGSALPAYGALRALAKQAY